MSDDARAKVDPPPAPAGGGLAIKADKLQFEALATRVQTPYSKEGIKLLVRSTTWSCRAIGGSARAGCEA